MLYVVMCIYLMMPCYDECDDVDVLRDVIDEVMFCVKYYI